MILIASWNSDQDPSTDEPSLVRWEDGTVAGLLDYRAHELDTYTFVQNGHDLEKHMFPSIVAEVRYDGAVGAWKISGRGVTPMTLEVTDPNAKDEELLMELGLSPTVYRATIVR